MGPPNLICGPVVQLVRMPACHAGGRGFEPLPDRHFYTEGFPSGQRGQTVNLLATPSLVRIQLPPPKKYIYKCKIKLYNNFVVKSPKSRKWLSGRASPCQGEGRGFESRLALFKKGYLFDILFLRARPDSNLNFYASLRSTHSFN